jgi:hypothetical protein
MEMSLLSGAVAQGMELFSAANARRIASGP